MNAPRLRPLLSEPTAEGVSLTSSHPSRSAPVGPSALLFAAVLLGLFFLLWELSVRFAAIPVYILPAPSRIFTVLLHNPAEFTRAALLTFSEAALGLLLGSAAGFSLALVLGLWPRLEQGILALAILLKSTPMVAIAPLLTIWLGFGFLPKVLITALLTFFPILVNAVAGLNSAGSAHLDTLRSWSASRRELLVHVRLPSALPYLFAAFKVSGPLALVGAVVAEWTGASGGLGRLMWLAYTNLNLPFLFGAVFLLAAAGIFIYFFIGWAERKFIFWEG